VLCGPNRVGDRRCSGPWLDWSRELLAPRAQPPSPPTSDAGITPAAEGMAGSAPGCQLGGESPPASGSGSTPGWALLGLTLLLVGLSRTGRPTQQRSPSPTIDSITAQ
jgi:hypothetical protein